jgi:hypothetical protein
MRRARKWLLVGLVVWIVVVTWWALRPVSDTVPTGAVKRADRTVVLTTKTVECDSPLSGSTRPTESWPALTGGRAYERTPCGITRENDRLIFAVDVLVAVAVLALLVKTWKPPQPAETPEDASVA